MPKSGAKHRFRGTNRHDIEKKTNAEDSSSKTSDHPSTSAAASPASPSSFRLSKISKKNPETKQQRSTAECSTGYRLIDLDCLTPALSSLHMCCEEGVTINDENENNGMCSKLSFVCLGCGNKVNFRTSKVLPDSAGVSYEVNRRAAYAATEMGVGREAIEDFTGIMGMPPPSKNKSWHQHCKVVNKAAEEEFEENTKTAGLNLRKTLEINIENSTGEETLDVAVSFDGTWHHRGFTSSHGIGVIMSVDTGEVLDAVALSKDCSTCLHNPNADSEWMEAHKQSGECEINFDGPSTSMETEACRILWSRSIEKHNMRYTKLLSDGDNKTQSYLNDELQPYGSDIKVDKHECVNHVNKRMGTGLRKLRKESKVVTGGRGGLTDDLIKKLGKHYRNAIIKNCTTSKNETDISKSIKNMEKGVLASLYHSVYNKNPASQHKYCPVDWCQYQQDKQNKTNNYDHIKSKEKKLPATFLKELLPLYKRLSEPGLLRRCVLGLTQNQNESFNATVWKKCPKEKRYGAASVKRALHIASATWNQGKLYDKMLKRMGIEPNWVTEDRIICKDITRVKSAEKKFKKKEKIRAQRLENINTEKQKRLRLGVDYVPGGH